MTAEQTCSRHMSAQPNQYTCQTHSSARTFSGGPHVEGAGHRPPCLLCPRLGIPESENRNRNRRAAQKSHRKIAVTTVAASGLATIPLEIAGFFASPAAKKSLAASDFWGLPQNRKKLAMTAVASHPPAA